MKRLSLIALTLTALSTLAGCASMSPKTEDLQAADKCTVWKEGLLGSKTVVEVDGELAKQKVTCWIMNMWGCTYTDYTFAAPGAQEIRSSLPPREKTIARLSGRRLSVDMAGVTVDPFELGSGRADYMLQGLIGPKQKMTVEYNAKCTPRQAALGLLTMIAK